ncbi:MAG: S-layer homology domain-containing protein, partial [Ruminococcaceae bacterium]|nr:S-layer homology domain-containing protein [Oscillospiraceae bacterium]
VEVILGTFEAQGKLPVNIPVYDAEANTYTDAIAYERGYGLTYAAAEGEHHTWNGLECEFCDATREYPFTDVPEGEFYYDSVLWAVDEGITTGATDTTFNPTGDLQRAQVVVMLWRAAGEPAPTTTVNPFTDVKETDFFYNAVLWAVEKGITTGTTATTFSPYGVTNRAQAVTFLWRYLDKPAATATNEFTDVVAGEWYEAAINWAVEKGVTNGLTATEFGINANCNRAHMVTFLYRAQ